MASLLRSMWKQGLSGQAFVCFIVVVGVVGVGMLATLYIMVAWDLVLSHAFGLPNLDVVSGLGILMIVAALVALFRKWGE